MVVNPHDFSRDSVVSAQEAGFGYSRQAAYSGFWGSYFSRDEPILTQQTPREKIGCPEGISSRQPPSRGTTRNG